MSIFKIINAPPIRKELLKASSTSIRLFSKDNLTQSLPKLCQEVKPAEIPQIPQIRTFATACSRRPTKSCTEEKPCSTYKVGRRKKSNLSDKGGSEESPCKKEEKPEEKAGCKKKDNKEKSPSKKDKKCDGPCKLEINLEDLPKKEKRNCKGEGKKKESGCTLPKHEEIKKEKKEPCKKEASTEEPPKKCKKNGKKNGKSACKLEIEKIEEPKKERKCGKNGDEKKETKKKSACDKQEESEESEADVPCKKAEKPCGPKDAKKKPCTKDKNGPCGKK